jgi:hypothetical protein
VIDVRQLADGLNEKKIRETGFNDLKYMFPKKRLLLILLSLPIIAYLLFEVLYINASYPNIKLGRLDVGGKNKSELRKLLQDELSNRQNRTLSFTIDQSKPLAVTLNTNLLQYDLDKTVENVVSYGKKGSLSDQFKQKFGLTKPAVLQPSYTFDEFTFDTLLADQLRPYESPVLETRIIYNNGQLVLSPSKPGRIADRGILINQVKQYIDLTTDTTVFQVKLETLQPKSTRENSKEALALAQRAISKQIILSSPEIPDQTWALDAPQLYDFLEFEYDPQTQKPTLTVANYKVASYSAQFAPLIDTPRPSSLFLAKASTIRP